MSVKFCVLGSGSDGNAALLMTPYLHVLIDAGFAPNELAARMDGTGASWASIRAIVLTHTHADHLKRKCLVTCAEYEIEFWCHGQHFLQLQNSRYFNHLHKKGLVRTYESATVFELGAKLNAIPPVLSNGAADPLPTHIRIHPIQVPHDCKPTYGFRIEARKAHDTTGGTVANEAPAAYGEQWAKLGYLVDLGDCAEDIAASVLDVDLLALEFNHDEHLQRTSGRHPSLIERVLGKDGHLSNKQAANVFRHVLERGQNGGPKVLVQMHLSRECNRAELAYEAAQQVLLLTGSDTQVFSTRQDRRGTVHTI